MLNFDPLQHFEWLIYISVGLIYSLFALFNSLSRKGGLIFARKNVRSLPVILAIHMAFLIILLLLMRAATHIYPASPIWLKETFLAVRASRYVSTFDILFVLVMTAMYYVESRCIYLEPEDTPRTISETYEP